MSIRHVEIHILPTAKDAARLEHAGLPRFDLEPTACGACNARVGELNNESDQPIAWRPFGVILDADTVDVLCRKCLAPFDKILPSLYA